MAPVTSMLDQPRCPASLILGISVLGPKAMTTALPVLPGPATPIGLFLGGSSPPLAVLAPWGGLSSSCHILSTLPGVALQTGKFS
jgi:hypothetical protein